MKYLSNEYFSILDQYLKNKMSDLAFIEHNINKTLFIPKNKTKKDVIKKLTHLYLNDKYISQIGFLGICENLQVLYLHNNEITKIQNKLEPLTTLKHLYLHKNKITKLEGLSTLTQLRKLYIGCNEISVIEGLDKLENLEELHAEKQRLCKSDSLCFDPRSICNLSHTLQILNISHNNITSLNQLEPLKLLKRLNASHNNLNYIEETAKVIQNLPYLAEVNFIGNPISKKYRYKDSIIANSVRLLILDDKYIHENTRCFIKRFEFEKSQHKLNSASRISVPKNLPGEIAPSLQNIIKQSISKSLSTTALKTNLNEDENENEDKYLPWNALKPSVTEAGTVCPPLFTKHRKNKLGTVKRVTFSMFPELP